jgi:hypothetical protein
MPSSYIRFFKTLGSYHGLDAISFDLAAPRTNAVTRDTWELYTNPIETSSAGAVGHGWGMCLTHNCDTT